jgi:hypothetical protein
VRWALSSGLTRHPRPLVGAVVVDTSERSLARTSSLEVPPPARGRSSEGRLAGADCRGFRTQCSCEDIPGGSAVLLARGLLWVLPSRAPPEFVGFCFNRPTGAGRLKRGLASTRASPRALLRQLPTGRCCQRGGPGRSRPCGGRYLAA